MKLSSYTAQELFKWVTTEGNDFLLPDVRVEEQFDQFKVEGPYLSKTQPLPIKRLKIKKSIPFPEADPRSRPYTCRDTHPEAHLISLTTHF
jgi:hypothetical protein